jgi:hypothetical protein
MTETSTWHFYCSKNLFQKTDVNFQNVLERKFIKLIFTKLGAGVFHKHSNYVRQ